MQVSQRQELVSELTSYYEFLVGTHLPADSLKRPPPGGWPDINQEQLGYLKKHDDVIDVLKHIPYIRQDDEIGYQIYESCVCNDFTGAHFARFSKKHKDVWTTEPMPEAEEIEPCIATLARPKSRDGYYIFYNTAEHTLELVDYQDAERRERGVKEFFGMLKDDWRSMSVYPVEPCDVQMAERCAKSEVETYQAILRRHGWASDNFQKDKCLEAMKAQDDQFMDEDKERAEEQRRLMREQ